MQTHSHPTHTPSHTNWISTHCKTILKELFLVQNTVTDQCPISKSREKVIFCLTGIPLTISLCLRHSHTHLNQTSPPPKQHKRTHLLIKSTAEGLFCVSGYACNVSVWSVKTDLMDQCPQLSLIRLQQVSPMIDSSQVSSPSLNLLEGGR